MGCEIVYRVSLGLTGIEGQRHIGSGRYLLFLLGPRGHVAPDSILAAVISEGSEFFENPDPGQPLALGLP